MKRLLAALLTLGLSLFALPAQAVELNYGYDVSYPQGTRVGSLPTPGPFTVVGVNGGRAFDSNSYLNALLGWAGSATELYVNTGNPGPSLTAYPERYGAGSAGGRTCYDSDRDSPECAFMYGYRFASNSYQLASSAFTAKGWGNLNSRTWWLDVETVNSWRGLVSPNGAYVDGISAQDLALAQALNVETIKGAVYYFQSVAQVHTLGIYSTTYQWGRITGGNTTDFSGLIAWHAIGGGATAETRAKALCQEQPGFTGGQKVRVQYIDDGLDLDVNVPCTLVKASTAAKYVGVKSVKVKRAMTLKVTLKTTRGVPIANKVVWTTFAGTKHRLVTNSQGIAAKKITAPKYRGNYRVRTTYSGSEILHPTTTTSYVKLYR